MAAWLNSLDARNIRWGDHPAWLASGSTQVDRRHKRAATFDVLNILSRAPICQDETEVSIQVFDLSAPQGDEPAEAEQEAAARLQIYKAIRRHAARRMGAWRLLPAVRDELIQIGGCGSVLSRTTTVPSALLGLIMWRRRFERYMNPVVPAASAHDRLELHPDVVTWPSRAKVPLAAWGYFVHRCLLQDCQAAANWAADLNGLPNERDVTWRAEWTELLAKWRDKTTPGAQRASDSITQLVIVRPGGVEQFALVWSSLEQNRPRTE